MRNLSGVLACSKCFLTNNGLKKKKYAKYKKVDIDSAVDGKESPHILLIRSIFGKITKGYFNRRGVSSNTCSLCTDGIDNEEKKLCEDKEIIRRKDIEHASDYMQGFGFNHK